MAETYKQALEDAKEELQAYLEDNKGSLSRSSAQDYIHELADSAVPIYNGDILEWAAENIDFATDTPEIGPAFDGSPTPINIIAANIYEALFRDLNDYLDDIWDDIE